MPDSLAEGLAAGTFAPHFRGRDVHGVIRTSRDLRGHRVLLIFVQTSCPYSARLLPLLASSALKPVAGVLPILILPAGSFASELPIPFPLLESEMEELASLFRLRGTPTAYLVDETGHTVGPALIGAGAILSQFGVSARLEGLPVNWESKVMPYPDPTIRIGKAILDARPGRSSAPPAGLPSSTALPLVSVIMPTCDRPTFLPLALRCFQEQTYPNRELIVVDDGVKAPVDEETVRRVGARLIRTQNLTLGEKLNSGAAAARGTLCAKMDDDDWYGPHFLETMAAALLASEAADPLAVVFPGPYLILNLAEWRLRRSPHPVVGLAGSLAFTRRHWETLPFRAQTKAEDTMFVKDSIQAGSIPQPVNVGDQFVVIRHARGRHDHPHAWTRMLNGLVEDSMRRWPFSDASPEEVLPAWTRDAYRGMRPRTSLWTKLRSRTRAAE
jgi:hypothetical protein